MMKNELQHSQELLLKWICLNEYVSWASIKDMCAYLNQQYDLGIEEHPAWHIFLPLFAAGNVEYYGEHKFRITPPIAIHGNGRYVYTNTFNQPQNARTNLPWVYCSSTRCPEGITKCYDFNAVAVLRNIPKCSEIVSKFNDVVVYDFDNLNFYNHQKSKTGVAWKSYNEHKFYFVNQYNNVKEVTQWSIDPDATNIAFSYTRAIDKFGNGNYNSKTKVLRVRKYRFPIIIYRILIIECLLSGYIPQNDNKEIIFKGISKPVVKELNRIFENSIQYE